MNRLLAAILLLPPAWGQDPRAIIEELQRRAQANPLRFGVQRPDDRVNDLARACRPVRAGCGDRGRLGPLDQTVDRRLRVAARGSQAAARAAVCKEARVRRLEAQRLLQRQLVRRQREPARCRQFVKNACVVAT